MLPLPALHRRIGRIRITLEPRWLRTPDSIDCQLEVITSVNGVSNSITEIFYDRDDLESRLSQFLRYAGDHLLQLIKETEEGPEKYAKRIHQEQVTSSLGGRSDSSQDHNDSKQD